MIRIENRAGGFRAPRRLLTRVLEGILATRAPDWAGGDAVVNLALADAEEMRSLNKRFTGRNGLTDVLAFEDGEIDPDEGRIHAGDIVVSVETARREAAARQVPVREELALYAAHGLLHILGFRDKTGAECRAMRAAEREALAPHGITPDWNA